MTSKCYTEADSLRQPDSAVAGFARHAVRTPYSRLRISKAAFLRL